MPSATPVPASRKRRAAAAAAIAATLLAGLAWFRASSSSAAGTAPVGLRVSASPGNQVQIEWNQTVCPACGAQALEVVPVLHHMICAYIGPEYDFIPSASGYTCPKCRHGIVADDNACEIVGTSARCSRCRTEMVVSPPPVSA